MKPCAGRHSLPAPGPAGIPKHAAQARFSPHPDPQLLAQPRNLLKGSYKTPETKQLKNSAAPSYALLLFLSVKTHWVLANSIFLLIFSLHLFLPSASSPPKTSNLRSIFSRALNSLTASGQDFVHFTPNLPVVPCGSVAPTRMFSAQVLQKFRNSVKVMEQELRKQKGHGQAGALAHGQICGVEEGSWRARSTNSCWYQHQNCRRFGVPAAQCTYPGTRFSIPLHLQTFTQRFDSSSPSSTLFQLKPDTGDAEDNRPHDHCLLQQPVRKGLAGKTTKMQPRSA